MIRDYGTLQQVTADATPLLMRHFGVGGSAALAASVPTVPNGGGGGPTAIVAGVEAGGPTPTVAGDEVVGVPDGAANGPGDQPGGPTGGGPGDGGGVAGGDQLPFTGLDAAATAAVGAAATAAGVALRKVADDPPRGQRA